jgi:flagellar biosynthesis/type III secretory pathway protein FliH
MVSIEGGNVMTDEEKTAAAVLSFQEFEKALEAVREEGYNAGYADGHRDATGEGDPSNVANVTETVTIDASDGTP